MEKTERPIDEPDLIRRLRLGDPVAFREAVRHYTPHMLAVGRFYLDSGRAEEVVQDSWVAVVKAIKTFEGRSGLKTWLHRIVANRAKNALRQARREIQTDFSDSPLEPELAERFRSDGRWAAPPRMTSKDSPEALMEKEALGDCLDKHLSNLPEMQRSALMLYEAHQNKSEDVSTILGVSASNLRVLLHRARQRIFLMVEKYQETGEC